MTRLIRESDLKNHLMSQPESREDGKTGEDADTLEKSAPDPNNSEMRDAILGNLQRDNQAMRALEILVGYGILNKARE